MFRRFLILLFVIANLSTQVSVAYACTMMGSTPQVMKQCCCEPDEVQPERVDDATGEGCCTTVVAVAESPGDQAGHLASATKLPDIDPQSLQALLPALLALVPPSQPVPVVWDPARDPVSLGTDLYLRTQRLRL